MLLEENVAKAWLLQIRIDRGAGYHASSKVFSLEVPFGDGEPRATVGRHADNNLTVSDKVLSRFHFSLTFKGSGDVELMDLGSPGGTFVNRHQTAGPTLISADDIISIGGLSFTITSSEVADDGVTAAERAPRARGEEGKNVGERVRVRRSEIETWRYTSEVLFDRKMFDADFPLARAEVWLKDGRSGLVRYASDDGQEFLVEVFD